MSREEEGNPTGGSAFSLFEFLTIAAVATLLVVVGIFFGLAALKVLADGAQAAPGSVPSPTADAGTGFHSGDAVFPALMIGALVYGLLVARDKMRARRFAREWEPRLREEERSR